jgi:hypothetical protein
LNIWKNPAVKKKALVEFGVPKICVLLIVVAKALNTAPERTNEELSVVETKALLAPAVLKKTSTFVFGIYAIYVMPSYSLRLKAIAGQNLPK